MYRPHLTFLDICVLLLMIPVLLLDSRLGVQQTEVHGRRFQPKLLHCRADNAMQIVGTCVNALSDACTVLAGPSRQAEGERNSAPDVVFANTDRRRAQQGRALKPSDMPVSRASLFYSSTFPAHAGFPSTREGSLILTSMCLKRFWFSHAPTLYDIP